MPSPSELSSMLDRACKHAKIPRAEVRLYVADGPAQGAQHALHLEPDSQVYYDATFPLTEAQRADANAPEHRKLHRLVVHELPGSRIGLGLLRHELEHARQWRQAETAYAFLQLACDTLAHAYRDAKPETLDGSASIYNALPGESDANRAAAALTLEDFGAPTEADLSGGFGNLFRDQGPYDPSTLARRQVALCALFREAFVKTCSEHFYGVDTRLRELDVEAPTWWLRLDTADVEAAGQRALSLIPSRAAVAAAEYQAAAWFPSADALRAGLELGETLLASG